MDKIPNKLSISLGYKLSIGAYQNADTHITAEFDIKSAEDIKHASSFTRDLLWIELFRSVTEGSDLIKATNSFEDLVLRTKEAADRLSGLIDVDENGFVCFYDWASKSKEVTE